MDQKDALKVALSFTDVVRLKFKCDKFYLFGSYIKGNFSEYSDIDIAVVMQDYNDEIDMQLELMRMTRKVDSRIEPHVFKKSDFELSNPLVYEIVKYGKEI
ncbi:MAG: nucleotidyltransferase domain-containing protein [Bacteroidota bacterium]|nr:nucleotidyltransferase domain-containing protein [Bacteroidota bacterium]